MSKLIRCVLAWFIVICAVPLIVVGKGASDKSVSEQTFAHAQPNENGAVIITSGELRVKNLETGEISSIDIEEYTVMAVMEEIPYLLDEEALKAQACAARTYAVRRILSGPEPSIEAHISNDSSKYQICLTKQQAQAIYGDNYENVLSQVRAAVNATKGEILMYDNAPCVAAFHQSSKKTLSSAEVWGKGFDYLAPATSPVGSYETEKKTFTYAEITARISADFDNAEKFDGLEISTGAENSVQLCGLKISTEDFVKIFSLASVDFIAQDNGECVEITAYGSGHLVGMSMMGADFMAKDGKSYRDILTYYYKNAKISSVAIDNGE